MMRFGAAALAGGLALLGGVLAARAADGPSATVQTEGGTATVHGGEAVKAAVQSYVAERTRGGVYRFTDERTGKEVALEFVHVGVVSSGALWRIHDPGRKVEDGASLACVRFHPVGAPAGNVYDVDFLLERQEANLVVADVRLHKTTRLVGGKWIWEDAEPRPAPDHRSGR
jgi:hypothetical protein